jgi:hypothetical protein
MTRLRNVWEGFKRGCRIIGDFNARVILTLFYFLILGPLSMVVRIRDPLMLRKQKPQGWNVKQTPAEPSMARMLQQW